MPKCIRFANIGEPYADLHNAADPTASHRLLDYRCLASLFLTTQEAIDRFVRILTNLIIAVTVTGQRYPVTARINIVRTTSIAHEIAQTVTTSGLAALVILK